MKAAFKVWAQLTDQNVAYKASNRLIRLGSEYGGWVIDRQLPKQANILSAGCGEDISFEVELLNRCKCKILIVDPTPRSRVHLEKVAANLGASAKLGYGSGGVREMEEYNLSDIDPESLLYAPVAIGAKDGVIELFPPENPAHVSFSCIPHQEADVGDAVNFQMSSVATLLTATAMRSLDILKLDVEGAEIEVLNSMLDAELYPTQICCEFDSLRFDVASKQLVARVMERLSSVGYSLIWCDRAFNALFVRERF